MLYQYVCCKNTTLETGLLETAFKIFVFTLEECSQRREMG